MKQEHKPLSSKKPPEPEESHNLIEGWIADVKPGLNPVVLAIDKLIRTDLKDPRYAIKWGKAYFGTPKYGWCIELVAYDVSVNIVFLNGDKLKDPPKAGGETRYVKIRSIEDANASQLKSWIKQSCTTKGWPW